MAACPPCSSPVFAQRGEHPPKVALTHPRSSYLGAGAAGRLGDPRVSRGQMQKVGRSSPCRVSHTWALVRVAHHRCTRPWACPRQGVSTANTAVCPPAPRPPAEWAGGRVNTCLLRSGRQLTLSRAGTWPGWECLFCPHHGRRPHLRSHLLPGCWPLFIVKSVPRGTFWMPACSLACGMVTKPFINCLLCAPDAVLTLPNHQPTSLCSPRPPFKS